MSGVIDALATYRLTRLVTRDRITARYRDAIRGPYDGGEHFVDCPWCVGMWIAFGVVAARRLAPALWSPVATALAFSAVAGIVSENT